MPTIEELENSDEEFKDAESDLNNDSPKASTSPATNSSETLRSNRDIVEEIIRKQTGLSLNDDGLPLKEEENEDENENAQKTSASAPEYLHDDVDEEALKQKEKTLTPEQLEENKEKANSMKLEANEQFKNDNCESAIDLYTEALQICPMKCTKERAVLYGNRAAAKIKMNSKKAALDDCTKALELWPDYVRVLLRRAKLNEHEDKLDEALNDYKRVFELDPGQNEAREAMIRLPPIINERNERLKEEMMGKLKELGNMILKPFGLSTSNFQMQQDPNTGSYSINFNQNNG